MIRRLAFASITGLCLLAACGDDDDEDGNNGGSGGTAGTAGKNTGGTQAGRGGTAGGGGVETEAGAGSGAMAGTTAGGSAGTPSTDGGTPGTGDAGSGASPVAGAAGTSGENGGAGGSEPGPTGEGGAAGDGGSGGSGEPGPLGLVARYTFDETAGTSAAEATGHFGPATLEKATFTPGRRGTNGVELKADQAYVAFPAGFFSGVQKATIAVWVNMAETLPWSRIYDFNSGAGFLYLASDRGGADGPQFTIYNGAPATEANLRLASHLPLNVWKHLAVTVDGTTYSLFVDGYLAERVEDNARTPADIAPTVNGWLGKSTFQPPPQNDPYFKGKLDDFQIHDVVLTQAQIAELAWPDGDYSYFRFNETSGAVAADSSDRQFHGTLTGGTFVAGRVGNALQLTQASSQYVSVDPAILTACDDFTLALWAKLDSVGNWTRFFDLRADAGRFLFFTPALDDNGTQKLFFNIYAGSDSGVIGTYPSGAVLAGQWHHYAVTLAGTVARLYFDGAEIGSNPSLAFTPSDVLPIGTEPHAWIGRSNFDAAPTFDPYLNGAVDELRVACRAFTPAEIRQLAH